MSAPQTALARGVQNVVSGRVDFPGNLQARSMVVFDAQRTAQGHRSDDLGLWRIAARHVWKDDRSIDFPLAMVRDPLEPDAGRWWGGARSGCLWWML